MRKLNLLLVILLFSSFIPVEMLLAESCCESNHKEPKVLAQGSHNHQEHKLLAQGKTADTPEAKDMPEFTKALSPVYVSYFKIQKSLALDKLDETKAGFQVLAQAVDQVKMDSLEDPSDQKEWQELAVSLKDIAKEGMTSQNLEISRLAFRELSNKMLELVERFNHSNQKPIREIRCAMAFDNKGAIWLTTDKETANPYFGKKMLQCGSLVKTYPSILDR